MQKKGIACLVGLAVAALIFVSGRAQDAAAAATLAHLYNFTSNLSDSQAGPAMTSDGGSVAGGRHVFGMNQGLRLQGGLPDTSNYSIALVMHYDSNGPRSWRKIIDFSNLVSDSGLYLHGAVLQLYPNADGITATTNGIDFHVVLTRDSSGATNGYVNGVLQWTFTDTDNDAVAASNLLIFFEDEANTGNQEEAAGSADCIGIFNGALTAGEALALANGNSCGTASAATATPTATATRTPTPATPGPSATPTSTPTPGPTVTPTIVPPVPPLVPTVIIHTNQSGGVVGVIGAARQAEIQATARAGAAIAAQIVPAALPVILPPNTGDGGLR